MSGFVLVDDCDLGWYDGGDESFDEEGYACRGLLVRVEEGLAEAAPCRALKKSLSASLRPAEEAVDEGLLLLTLSPLPPWTALKKALSASLRLSADTLLALSWTVVDSFPPITFKNVE